MTDSSLHLGSEEAHLSVCVCVQLSPLPRVSYTLSSAARPSVRPSRPRPPSPPRPLTLLFDLADLPHRLFEDGTFVRFDVEAVDVAEVGGDQLGQLLDVFALLLPSLPLAPAEGGGNVHRSKPRRTPWRRMPRSGRYARNEAAAG